MPDEPRAIIAAEVERALADAGSASSLADLEQVRVSSLGRKAPMSAIKSTMGALSNDERREVGMLLNDARDRIEAALADRGRALATAEEAARLERDRVDVTLPGRPVAPGHPHPLSLVTQRLVDIFVGMGYHVAEGPEVESDWYCFEALNMPPHHPARSTQDTMYVADSDLLLRTHTSSVQVRAMEKQEPPIYVVAPGRVYRRDPFDATHAPQFQQLEGLAIDRGLGLAELKGTLIEVARALFGPKQKIRMRPYYFPYTEPSAEVDVVCVRCGGDGCPACSHSGWMEILGCGVVHPNVLRNVGWDPEEWSGFACGVGVERITMVAYYIHDLLL
ncbi:MAG: phenylalanine--tRNA ligase subunit alpha, partial [Actinobacteria bacterium]|nr:phenylalanine--tRNA ligase subunit alpha [Actinomycetota bacterium]